MTTTDAPPYLLVVAGSRSLAESLDSMTWLIDHLDPLIAYLVARKGVLMQGGAPGPDLIAAVMAKRWGVRVVTYRKDGTRLDTHGPSSKFMERGHPLERNRLMMKAAAAAVDKHWDVDVVGFFDPTSRTQGTLNALSHAASFSLNPQRLDCPNDDSDWIAALRAATAM